MSPSSSSVRSLAWDRKLPQLEAAIAAQLCQGYLHNPDVTTEIDSYRPVFIIDEVSRPGQYPSVPSMTMQNAIAISSCFTPRANQVDVDITSKINQG